MSQKSRQSDNDLLPGYDFSGAVRGKYYKRYLEATNVVLLDPDVALAFRDSASVNDALRLLVSIADAKVTRRPTDAKGVTPQPKATRR